MKSELLRLPDGQVFSVGPVFAGVGFRSLAHSGHDHAYPVGWTVVLHTDGDGDGDDDEQQAEPRPRARPFVRPTRAADSLFISSIANPPASEAKAAASPTRRLAMLLWVTLYWYFHHPPPPPPPPGPGSGPGAAGPEPEPEPEPEPGSGPPPPSDPPRPEWRVRVRAEGALRAPDALAKLERMGLVACRRSAVVPAHLDDDVFVTQPAFWQTPGRLFLFAPEPAAGPAAGPSTPAPAGPFASTSHLPTYYPPPPPHYVTSPHGVRHPLRPRPPHMGDVFYSRFVPSVGQYLAFRVASSSPSPVPYRGPVGPSPPDRLAAAAMSDAALLEAWHAKPRVARFWGPYDPAALDAALAAPHSFPVIGLWDGVPFGYFELYWVKEDLLGRHVAADVADWDRGLHIMIGEDWARARVAPWLTSLVHWSLTADLRTMSVCLEPRVDNQRMLAHLDALGFVREKQVALPHKQAWFVRLRRESWQGPAL